MGSCEGCPVGEKIKLYKEAGEDSGLADRLAKEQGIDSLGGDFRVHFDRTAETILRLGCLTKILCGRRK